MSTVLTKILLDFDGVVLRLLVVVMVVVMMMIISSSSSTTTTIVITTATAVQSIRRISAKSMQVLLLTKFHIFLHYYEFFKLKVLLLFCT